MSATLVIGGVSYTFIENNNGEDSGVDQTNTVDERQRLLLDVIDYTGSAHFVYGEQVTLTDPVLGIVFNGIINTDKEVNKYPSGVIRHSIDCIDLSYFAGKRTYTRTYDTPTFAGKIVVDHLHDVLAEEGIAQNYALHYDSTTTDFMQGILSGAISLSNVDNGDLELAKAGSDATISVNLASGTLTNVVYAAGVLAPTLTSTIKITSTLIASAGQNNVYMRIWSGSKSISTNDTLTFDVWVPSTNKEIDATLDVLFSDTTRMNVSTNGNVYDQNGIPSFTVAGSTYVDLSSYAQDQWYHRIFTFPSGYNGKTAVAVQVGVGGSSAGTFSAYFKNIVLAGTTLFASNATTFQTTPYVDHSNGGFTVASSRAAIVQSFDPETSFYVSASTSISAVQLLRASVVQWVASNVAQLSIYASYDGNSYLACTANSALPALPAGSNVASVSLSFQAHFQAGGSGTDPTSYTSLKALTATLLSAPNPTSAKSDVTASYGTQTAWNTGTNAQTTALVTGVLTLDTYTRNWNDGLITNQTYFHSTVVTTESVASSKYQIVMPTTGSLGSLGVSRLDFAGVLLDFTLDVDVTLNQSATFAEVGVTYRQIGWIGLDATYGYLVTIDGARIQFGYGANTNTGSQSFNPLTTVAHSFPTSTTIHLKVVVSGPRHTIYVQNSSTSIIDWTDSTYMFPGNIGLRGFNGLPSTPTLTTTWDNLVINPSSTGTWVSPSTSISALGTCGGSVIAWTELNTGNATAQSITIQTSIDGGSSYQVCTNGESIPGITAGTNVSGKSVLVQAILNTNTQYLLPGIDGLIWRVLGAYPGSSGTRSTVPLGLDTVVRANQSGAGTSSDGQSYAQTGTGTVAIASNELTITNTTGDVYLILGSRTGSDMEGTHHFALSTSVMVEGLALRYVNANNFYRLEVRTTTLTLTKKSAGVLSTLKTAAITLSTGTFYNLRFRVTGGSVSVPVLLEGRVWADGVVEPTNWTITASD